MTDTTCEIFEKYQIRKSKKQKNAFIEYVQQISNKNGYTASIEKGPLGVRNIVIGEPTKAKVVYTAHYDTCAVLPFPNFITPQNIMIYILYQLAITTVILALIFLFFVGCCIISLALNFGPQIPLLLSYVFCVVLLGLLVAGPANKHTANDNTSGVTLIIDIMQAVPNELRNDVAFILFDQEETGLFGSMSFAMSHKKDMKDRLLINFDCVSDGENILFALRKKAKKYRQPIEKAFQAKEGFKVIIANKGTFYPSDQMQFSRGVGVAALRSTKKGLLYMNRIHTPRDVIYREENIEFLKEGSVKLLDLL